MVKRSTFWLVMIVAALLIAAAMIANNPIVMKHMK
jgi:uncharacterized membrane protein YhaH (DUF805 family)